MNVYLFLVNFMVLFWSSWALHDMTRMVKALIRETVFRNKKWGDDDYTLNQMKRNVLNRLAKIDSKPSSTCGIDGDFGSAQASAIYCAEPSQSNNPDADDVKAAFEVWVKDAEKYEYPGDSQEEGKCGNITLKPEKNRFLLLAAKQNNLMYCIHGKVEKTTSKDEPSMPVKKPDKNSDYSPEEKLPLPAPDKAPWSIESYSSDPDYPNEPETPPSNPGQSDKPSPNPKKPGAPISNSDRSGTLNLSSNQSEASNSNYVQPYKLTSDSDKPPGAPEAKVNKPKRPDKKKQVSVTENNLPKTHVDSKDAVSGDDENNVRQKRSTNVGKAFTFCIFDNPVTFDISHKNNKERRQTKNAPREKRATKETLFSNADFCKIQKSLYKNYGVEFDTCNLQNIKCAENFRTAARKNKDSDSANSIMPGQPVKTICALIIIFTSKKIFSKIFHDANRVFAVREKE